MITDNLAMVLLSINQFQHWCIRAIFLGLGVENTAENNFTVYPNPTKSILTIKNNSNIKITKINIIDASGKIVMEEKEYNSMNVQNLPAGIYHLQILSDGKTIQKKFIKE